MSWSYISPSNSPSDAVRFAIGDTVSTAQKLSNEEILYLLDQASGAVDRAAVLACDALIARYSHLVSQSTGSVSVSYSDLIRNYTALKAALRKSRSRPIPYAGGISVSDKEAVDEDDDRVKPKFYVGMHDSE